MIRLLLLLLACFLISVTSTFAQDIEVVEQCITDFREPPDDWTFDGTIITFKQGDGVHGFRADTPSRYYIAFNGIGEFSGAFSPNGHWLATYLGGRTFHFNNPCCNASYYVDTIRVVSTTPDRETYLIPIHKGYYGTSGYPTFSPVIWQDNSHFVAVQSIGLNGEVLLINPFEGEIEELSDDITIVPQDYSRTIDPSLWRQIIKLDETPVSDLPRAFLAKTSDSTTLHTFSSATQEVVDTCIKLSADFSISPTGNQIAISGQEGGFVYVVDLDDWVAYRLDLAANHVVAWIADD